MKGTDRFGDRTNTSFGVRTGFDSQPSTPLPEAEIWTSIGLSINSFLDNEDIESVDMSQIHHFKRVVPCKI